MCSRSARPRTTCAISRETHLVPITCATAWVAAGHMVDSELDHGLCMEFKRSHSYHNVQHTSFKAIVSTYLHTSKTFFQGSYFRQHLFNQSSDIFARIRYPNHDGLTHCARPWLAAGHIHDSGQSSRFCTESKHMHASHVTQHMLSKSIGSAHFCIRNPFSQCGVFRPHSFLRPGRMFA